MSVRSGRRRGLPDTDEDTPRSADSGGSSAIDDETEESLIAKRVERLASSLQDTGKNLRNVSGMLEEFKDRDQDRGAAIDHLRVELQQSTELLREERRRSIKERERLKIPGVARGRSMSPRFARRVEMHATHGVMPESHVRPRSNRSVSPGILGSRRSTGQQYRQYTSGIPLHLPGDLGGNGNIWNDMPASDRSGGDETKQLLQELVENQRNLLQVQAQPQLMQHPHGYNNENDRLAQLESMLTKLQNDMKVSKSGSKVSGRQFENPDISEELRKEMMNGHVTPQIRSPRANTGGSQRATKYSSSTSAPEDEREASSEQSERNLKRKLIRSESAIAELEKQLDDAHRRLENSEVGRGEGQRQVVELREQLNRSEQDREQLRTRVNDYTHDIQREVSKREEAFASEKRILEEEIRRLKGQLNDPRRNTEFETMKAEVEKLDKLKSTLGKRVEEVQKKNQEKDMEATEFTYKMREMTNKLEDSDRVKKKAISRVDDLTRELNVLKIEREKIVEQLRNAETQLNQKTKETEEITTKSKTIINALKTKTQKLTNDLDKATNAHQSHVDRINQLEREVEAGRLQATAAAASKDRGLVTGADSGQLAAIHKEIHDVMVMRGEQEDLMRRKNEEIHDLRGELESLQRAHTSLKDDMDKVDEEITLNRKRLMEAESTRDEQEDELIKLRTEGEVTRDELNRASAKAEELAIQVEQLQRRISEEVKEKEENKMALIQTEKKERLAREEISSLLIKLSEQEQMHNRVVGELKRDIQELVDVEQKNVQQMVQGMKAERNQLETEIANLRLEVSNEKESARDMRENLEKLERELIEASDNSKKQAETELALSTKVEALQFEITIKDNLAQELESRIKKLERTLKAAKEKLKKEEHDRLTVMSTVSKGVNGLVDAAAGEGSLGRHKSNTPMASGADANAWLAEIKAKMSWLLTEVTSWYSKEKDVQHQLKRTQQDILTLLNNSNQDKSFFIEQLEKQGSQIKHISTEKEDVRLGNIDQESRLMTLHHNVEDLSNRLQMSSQLLEARLNMLHLHKSNPNTNPDDISLSVPALNNLSATTTPARSRPNSYCSSRLSPNPQLVTTFVDNSASTSLAQHHGATNRSELADTKLAESFNAATDSNTCQSKPLSSSKNLHDYNLNHKLILTPENEAPDVKEQMSNKCQDSDFNNNLSSKVVSFFNEESENLNKSSDRHLIQASSTFYVPLSKLKSTHDKPADELSEPSKFDIELLNSGTNPFDLEPKSSEPKSASSPKPSSSILSFFTNKLSSNTEKEAERDEYEFSVKNSRCETMTNGDLYYPNNKYFSSMAASGAPMTVYSAARLDSDRIGTDSTVTPEQSVLHYTQPFTLDFSAVPFHLVAAADGLAVHPSQHQMVYPQSSSTPAPVPMSKVAADRLTHTPPTKHNAGDWHAAMSSAGRSINTGGVPNGIYGTTSSAFQPMMSSVNLNTKAPMSMTDEEFRAQFIPNAPPAEPTMIPMQPEKEFFAGRK